MVALFIAGTDTGAGKTIVTAALAAYWLQWHRTPVAILKPVQCAPGDREYYRSVFGDSLTVLNPLYFDAPIAPPLAAEREGRSIDLGLLWEAYQQALGAHALVLVEGVGGLGTPLTRDYTVADLARDWRVPVLLVAPLQLGVVGQLVAHTGYGRALGLDLRAIALSEVKSALGEQDTLASTPLIEQFCRLPVLGRLAHLGSNSDRNTLAAAASHLWLEVLGREW